MGCSAGRASEASCCLSTVNVSHSGSCTSLMSSGLPHAPYGITCRILCTRYERAYVAQSGSPMPRTVRIIRRTWV